MNAKSHPSFIRTLRLIEQEELDMLLEEQRDKETSIQRNSGLIVSLRGEMADSEKKLLLLLKRFKEKKLSEGKYLEIIRSHNSSWISQLSLNEIKNLLFIIAEVKGRININS